MPLNPGTRIGPYEIVAAIGAGGMGEVYRARDTKLGRDVAIKVLPAGVTANPERTVRFEREARTLASLNHSNIGAIYGLEDSSGTTALILELVEGPTLADRLAQGPLPLSTALSIATQIADALEAAHEKGIVHRDLKPSNVKVRPDGSVKVLDFGLAKAYESVADSDRSQSPTLTSPAQTLQGVILGTAAYMSPEQASGGTVDQQSDIWSFGVVLCEMLTGRPLFDGDSVARVLARVLERDLDFDTLPATTPPAIRRLLRRCVERDRTRRLRSIADARIEIADAITGREDAPVVTIPASHRTRIAPLTGVLAALVLVFAGLAAWLLMRPDHKAPRPTVRSSFPVPSLFGSPLGEDIAISRDGTRLVYGDITGRFHVRMLDQVGFTQIPDVANAFNPIFSPDGGSIAFVDFNRNLKRVSVSGGAPTTLTNMDNLALGLAWGAHDDIVFGTISSRGLMRVSARGGTPERITTVEGNDTYHAWPTVLPNAKGVLFSACSGPGSNLCRIAVVALKTGQVTYLTPGTSPRYASSGHLVYAADGAIKTIRFDQDHLTLGEDSPTVIDRIAVNTAGGAEFDVADNGSLVYVRGGAVSPQRSLAWVDRSGHETNVGLEPRGFSWVRVSPDGKRVAVEAAGGAVANSIWVSDSSRPALTPITPNVNSGANFPLWTPDGKMVVYSLSGRQGLGWTAADGTSTSHVLFSMKDIGFISAEGWTGNGKTLVFTYGALSQLHIGLLSMEGHHAWKPLIDRATDASMISISPDQKWLAYQSSSSGQYEIYMERFPDLGDRQRISTQQGGWAPVWSHDGREIFYRRVSDGAMMAARVQTTPVLTIGEPVRLFESKGYDQVIPPQAGGPAGRTFDVAPDGRFLMIKESQPSATGDIILVQNWFEELKQRVPTK
jgi:serine/threonine-protein kinase